MALIMVVDDEQQVLSLISTLLEKEGHQVVQAVDGEQALRLFTKQPTDMLITDLLMPNKEGLELIQEIRNNHSNVKIIAYSGGGQIQPDNYLNFAKGMGADRVFSKPVPLNELKVAVIELLAENNSIPHETKDIKKKCYKF